MAKIRTDELESVLQGTHTEDLTHFFESCREEMLGENHPFTKYMRGIIREKKESWQEVFLRADIPERYGYKLISGEKRTRKRDVIYRICFAAHMDREELRQALRLYGMPDLYVRQERDAVLIRCFSEDRLTIDDVNQMLCSLGMEMLSTVGTDLEVVGSDIPNE